MEGEGKDGGDMKTGGKGAWGEGKAGRKGRLKREG